MSNKITVMGNVTKDVKIVTTDSGRKFATFTVADSSFYRDDNTDEWVSARDTLFWDFTAGDSTDLEVKRIVSNLKKGDAVEVVGSITNVSGVISKQNTVYINTRVSVKEITLIPRKTTGSTSNDSKAPF